MPVITISHPDLSQSSFTNLKTGVAKDATQFFVQNVSGFAANDFVVIGVPGAERTEIRRISSIVGAETVNITAPLSFAHSADEPITLIKFDQIRIYRATSELGTYSLIATLNITINALNFTRFDDTGGTDSSWYKIEYFNSFTSLASAQSDPIQGTGLKDASLGKMRERVRKFADIQDAGAWPDEIIDLEILEEQKRFRGKPYRFLEGMFTMNLTLNVDSITLSSVASDVDRPFFVRIVDGAQAYSVPYIPPDRFFRRKTDVNETARIPTGWTEFAGIFYWLEKPAATITNAVTVLYRKKLPTLDSLNDETLVSQPDVLVFGAARRIAIMRADRDRKSNLDQLYAEARALIDDEMNAREAGPFQQVLRVKSGRMRGGELENVIGKSQPLTGY